MNPFTKDRADSCWYMEVNLKIGRVTLIVHLNSQIYDFSSVWDLYMKSIFDVANIEFSKKLGIGYRMIMFSGTIIKLNHVLLNNWIMLWYNLFLISKFCIFTFLFLSFSVSTRSSRCSQEYRNKIIVASWVCYLFDKVTWMKIILVNALATSMSLLSDQNGYYSGN